MPRKLTFRQLRLSILALWYDRSWKEVGAPAGIPGKQVSQHLRRGPLTERAYELLLQGLPSPPGAVEVVTSCLEGLEALETENGLSPEEKAEIERAVLRGGLEIREGMADIVRSRRSGPADYPGNADLPASRQWADKLWGRLAELPAAVRLEVVRGVAGYQSWALCERVCDQSEQEASRQVERAASLARLAQEIAERVPGSEDWRRRLRGYAAAHAANVLRVAGKLTAADATLEAAKRLWQAGADPAAILDPGRLLDLEASLRRAQRRFEEALALLDTAIALGRSPARALIKKGFTLEVMGEYGRAVETLLLAAPLVERQGDPRLLYMLLFNLAVNFCHTGSYGQATELVEQVRGLATELGDEIFLIRVVWLEGRIAAGLGRRPEARSLLAQARRDFAARRMGYDMALALLEEAVLLLDQGHPAEVKELVRGLAEVFAANGVHREALAALRVFQEAVERESATTELARRVLRFLYQARHDQGLRFTS
jgi:tetratricopeptide (TPR) repeat protein